MSEKQGYREAMGRMTDQLVKSGVKPKEAQKISREAAIRRDKSKK